MRRQFSRNLSCKRQQQPDVAYAPFGEDYANSGTTDLSFAGHSQDMITGLYDSLFREYHATQGRWISPDPAGLDSVNGMPMSITPR
jgi:RHS repeat-associated protein